MLSEKTHPERNFFLNVFHLNLSGIIRSRPGRNKPNQEGYVPDFKDLLKNFVEFCCVLTFLIKGRRSDQNIAKQGMGMWVCLGEMRGTIDSKFKTQEV